MLFVFLKSHLSLRYEVAFLWQDKRNGDYQQLLAVVLTLVTPKLVSVKLPHESVAWVPVAEALMLNVAAELPDAAVITGKVST